MLRIFTIAALNIVIVFILSAPLAGNLQKRPPKGYITLRTVPSTEALIFRLSLFSLNCCLCRATRILSSVKRIMDRSFFFSFFAKHLSLKGQASQVLLLKTALYLHCFPCLISPEIPLGHSIFISISLSFFSILKSSNPNLFSSLLRLLRAVTECLIPCFSIA